MSLYLGVVLNNIGGILSENGHYPEARQMYKTALRLTRNRFQDDGEVKCLVQAQLEQLGHELLEKYRTTARLQKNLISKTKVQNISPVYCKALYVPLELLKQAEECQKGNISKVEALILATILLNFAIHSHMKFASDVSRTRAMTKALRLYAQIADLAQQIVNQYTIPSCPVSILAHFLKFVALNNQASLYAYKPYEHAVELNDSILSLLRHAVSKQCRDSDWKDFSELKEEATDFMVRAILLKNELDEEVARRKGIMEESSFPLSMLRLQQSTGR